MAPHVIVITIAILVATVSCYEPEDFKTRSWEDAVQRPEGCYTKVYPHDLPSASVIITTLDEEVPLLEENIKSILYRSPPQFLKEIIVVDDAGERIPVPESILRFPKVSLVRTPEAKGVAGARIAGADTATGDVFIFLDSHMEVTANWLEPLLEYVQENPYGVAASIIDVLEADKGYSSSADLSVVTVLVKHLDFKWTTQINHQNITEKGLYSPVLLGSAFAISNIWWAMGGYDPGLRIWGIENIELAVRTWTCGQKVVFHPCSHVGHYYRAVRPNPQKRWFEQDFMLKNGIRFADVWMDDYKYYYYKHIGWSPERIANITSAPDLEERRDLRRLLDCKPFSWYIQNVVYWVQSLYNIRPALGDDEKDRDNTFVFKELTEAERRKEEERGFMKRLFGMEDKAAFSYQ